MVLLFYYLRLEFIHRSPCSKIREIKYQQSKWHLVNQKGEVTTYTAAAILIHNGIFQLLKFSEMQSESYVLLFNDQLNDSQLRQLHQIINVL